MSTVSDLIAAINLAQQEISDALTQGHVVNFETYQRLVGQHQGLQKSLDILNNLLKEEEKDVD